MAHGPASDDRTMAGVETRNALITGAGGRIGRAIAEDLARDGWGVAVHYRGSGEAARALVRQVTAGGGRAVALGADLTDEAETLRLAPEAVRALGPLTLLVNNASVFEKDTFATLSRAHWDAHMAVNLRAPFVLIQAFAEQLPEGASGNVVNMLDERVWNLTPHFLAYTLSKSGLWTLTRTLALALAPRIRVNGIGPGPTLPSRHQTEEQFRAQCAIQPLRRGTTPEEICRALRFILDSPALTGQMIALDGGQHLNWASPIRYPMPENG